MKAVHLTGYGLGALEEEIEAVESLLKEYEAIVRIMEFLAKAGTPADVRDMEEFFKDVQQFWGDHEGHEA